MTYSVRVRILGKEPGDIPKMLSAVERASSSLCKATSRGTSWLLIGCDEGLLSSQVRAFMSSRMGGTTIMCLVSLSSNDPKWIVDIVDRIKAEANSLGYPVLLETENLSKEEGGFPRVL